MMQVSNLIVSTFDFFAGFGSKISGQMSPSVKEGLTSLAQSFSAGSQKSFYIKPVSLIGDILSYNKVNLDQHPTLSKLYTWSQRAKTAKSFLNPVEVISNLSAVCKAFSEKIKPDGESIRKYVAIKKEGRFLRGNPSQYVLKESPKLSPVAAVGKRCASLGLLLISLSDAASELKYYRPLPPLLDRSIPLIYTGVGGLLGAQKLYEEGVFAKETWWKKDSRVHPSEIAYSVINMLTSTSYLATSFFNGLKMAKYANKELPKWLEFASFASNVAAIGLPLVQAVAKKGIDILHTSYKPKDKPE